MTKIAAILLILAAAGVAHADKAKACQAKYDKATKLFDKKKYPAAAKAFAKGYKACGAGHGFLAAEGFVLETENKLEDAAALFLQEASEPGPQPVAFGNLERIRDQLSDATRAKIVAMGGTLAAPVHVIGIDGEYSWARAFTCLGAKDLGNVDQKIASDDGNKMLDELTFTCPDTKVSHTVYFDYGEDPGESEYEKERAAIDGHK